VAVKVVLDTPIVGPTTPDLEICHLELHRGVKFVGAVRILDKALSYININVVGQNGVSLPFAYTGATAVCSFGQSKSRDQGPSYESF
jgi:hypothetical protein